MAVGDLPAPVISTVNATATSSVAVPFNGKRERLYIENLSLLYDVYLNWGADAVLGQGRRLQAGGGGIEINLAAPAQDDWAKDAVHVIATGASAALSLEELSTS